MRELRAGLTGSNAQQLVVMGVSGAGKTTIAAHLAAHLEYAFADGDDFQPKTNVAKLARAEPLTDADREPWLAALAEWIGNHHRLGRSTVLACSALKRHYRDTLRTAAPNVLFIHLAVPGDVAVISFDGSDMATWLRPRVTSLGLPFRAMGSLAVEILMSSGRGRPSGVSRLPLTLQRGESV